MGSGKPERRSMKRCGQTGGLALVALLAAACSPGDVTCPNEGARHPILVEVRDATTGEPAAAGATGSIRARDGSATIFPFIPGVELVLLPPLEALGRHGTYDVVVRKAGYRDWERNGVYARGSDSCGGTVTTVTLQADLEPLP